MVITNFLERNAQLWADDTALVELNPEKWETDNAGWKEAELVMSDPFADAYRREMTWKEFDDETNRIANLLIDKGYGKDDKIAILMMNSLEWLPIYFGILKAGCIAVPLNFRYASDEIGYCLDLADVALLFFGTEFIERLKPYAAADGSANIVVGVRSIPTLFTGVCDCPRFSVPADAEIAKYPSKKPDLGYELNPEDNAAIYFSSGTTGFPKAILHAHRSLTMACKAEQAHHAQTREDVFLCIPPLYHTGAKMHWFGSLLSGSKGVILKGAKPSWIIDAAANERASIVWLLVPWAQDILDAIDRGDIDLAGKDLSRWRLMHIGAQPVPPSLIKRWKQKFPHHAYDTNYGLSESIGPGCVHLGTENVHKVGAIGKAGYLWETKIVDERRETVTRGEVGELAVRGDGVMKEYYKNPEATAEILTGDGWLITGDMAREDDDGFIFLVDRKKDVIITGGENLYPVQIEDFLRGNDAIKDVAVIGLPDDRLGEIAAAIIELKPGEKCTEDDVQAFCADLPRYKRPRKVIFAPVPRNPTGKIEKPKLREIYAGGSVVEKQVSN
jgi:acyl-CoA synthetase (AMP-forming)/AMP-acid ligase II